MQKPWTARMLTFIHHQTVSRPRKTPAKSKKTIMIIIYKSKTQNPWAARMAGTLSNKM